MKTTFVRTMIIASALLSVAACDVFKKEEQPQYGSLKQNLMLVDGSGRRYGRIEMDPVSGGKLYDNQNQIIGTIVTPAVTSTVTTVTPVAPAYQ